MIVTDNATSSSQMLNGIKGTAYDRRPDFLIQMYGELMGDINRHIVVIWQMVGVLAASVAALVLTKTQDIPTAYIVTLVLLVSAWVLEHIYDSNFWYNRNLVMITNIERVFLTQEDLALIHPYFGKHRSKSSFLTHLKIQRRYTWIVIGATLSYFVFEAVLPTLSLSNTIDLRKGVPFLALLALVWRSIELHHQYDQKYADFLAISPGIPIEQDIQYGLTHGAK